MCGWRGELYRKDRTENDVLEAFLYFYREKAKYKLGHTQLGLLGPGSGDF